MRDMLFVSHANPEDNDFAQWISLQLAREGFPVWCDLTKLLGGETFWKDVEVALRGRTIKFVSVLSRTSNTKQGPRDELDLALKVQRLEGLNDFVIPLWIDDLPSGEFNVNIGRITAIRFQEGWAAGFARLLKKLEEEKVLRKQEFNPGAVASWWRDYASATQGVKDEPEPLISNWYPLEESTLYFHELARKSIGPIELPPILPFPATKHNQYMVAFAPAEDFRDAMGSDLKVVSSFTRRINSSNPSDEPQRIWSYSDERKAISSLLRQAWSQMLRSQELPTYTFANQALGFFFVKDKLPSNRGYFIEPDGSSGWRSVVGTKTLKDSEGTVKGYRYWHFCLEAKPTSFPYFGYTMKSHVLFSDDGVTLWQSQERMHRARRSQCRNWWNDRWRGLIGAGVNFLADSDGKLRIQTGAQTYINLSISPLSLVSPVSLDESSFGVVDLEEEAVDPAGDVEEDALAEEDEEGQSDGPDDHLTI